MYNETTQHDAEIKVFDCNQNILHILKLKQICLKFVFCGDWWGIDFAGKQICRVIDWRHWTR